MTQAKQINTLSEFLLQAQTQYIVFDLGRGIKPIDNQQFFDWENQLAPCAYPRQEHAWFCICFWNEKESQEQYIWYIKLPLDENGLLIQAARNQFLEIVVTALGSQLQHTSNEEAQLPENPFVFQPSQQQLADCNAHIHKALKQTRAGNNKVVQYMQAPSVQDWQILSVQDIADYVSTSDSSDACPVQLTLAKHLMHLPVPMLSCLFASLECIKINDVLSKAIIAFYKSSQEPVLRQLSLRALSHFEPANISLANHFVEQLILRDEALDIETLVLIAGRYWHILNEESILLSYMDKVAAKDNSFALFLGIYADLVKVPSCRASMLGLLRNTKRSDLVSQGIGKLFSR